MRKNSACRGAQRLQGERSAGWLQDDHMGIYRSIRSPGVRVCLCSCLLSDFRANFQGWGSVCKEPLSAEPCLVGTAPSFLVLVLEISLCDFMVEGPALARCRLCPICKWQKDSPRFRLTIPACTHPEAAP